MGQWVVLLLLSVQEFLESRVRLSLVPVLYPGLDPKRIMNVSPGLNSGFIDFPLKTDDGQTDGFRIHLQVPINTFINDHNLSNPFHHDSLKPFSPKLK